VEVDTLIENSYHYPVFSRGLSGY